LALWVDHEGITIGAGDHDSVLDGKIIRWKTFHGPVANLGLRNQELGQLEVALGWNTSLLEIILEVLGGQNVSELRVEWSAVTDEGASLGNVSDEFGLLLREHLGSCLPSFSVVSQRIDEPVGLVHLLSGSSGICSKLILFVLLIIELSLEVSLKLLHFCKLRLSFGQVRLGILELSGGNFESLHLWLDDL